MISNLSKNLTGILLFLFFTATITAEITSVKIQSDNRKAIHFNEFEFTQNGHVSVAISSASVTTAITSSLSPPADPSRIGFFLVSQDNLSQFRRERTPTQFIPESLSCDLDSKFITILFTFQDLSPPHQSSFSKSYNVTYPNWYSLRFANCNPLSYLSMDVRTELYNTNVDGNTKDYLSAGLTKLPSLYFNFSLIYPSLLGFWILICFKNHQSFHWIHLLIGVLLVVKEGNLLCGAEIQPYLKVTGTDQPHGLNLLFYIFKCIRVALLYSMIAATPTKKVLILMVVIPLEVYWGILVVVKGEISTDSVNAVFIVINFICLCAIIYQMIPCNDSCQVDLHREAKNYSKKVTPLSEWFPIVGVAYLVIELILGIDVTCSDHWTSYATKEIACLGFFLVMLFMFMPVDAIREEEYSCRRKENIYQFEV